MIWRVLSTSRLTRVGQGLGAYGIHGSYKSGIRCICAEIWVLSISFVLHTHFIVCFVYNKILAVNVHYVPFNFGYIGGNLGILGTVFSGILVYQYHPPPPPADPESLAERITL